VTIVDKPRIELIRSRALTAMQSYRRRRSSARPTIGRRQYAYSYTRPGWAPLGIQIFRDRIERLPLPISVELGDRPVPRQSMTDGVVEQEMFSLDAEGNTNPYSWEVDLCAVTLANFNYRTLTLVRDYEALIASPVPNPAFDELFSTNPRDLPDLGMDIPAEDRYLVVPADTSQLGALSQARATDNFVIQGPPGTGKSQTITNLIADYLARGKRVLFVCQKRAALDVVHARLRAQGLDEVCTLIHDSQQDKKAFVHGLRDTYEAWLAATDDVFAVEHERGTLVRELATLRQSIELYESALTANAGGVRLADVLDRLIALGDSSWGADLTPAERQLLPSPSVWDAARPVVDALADALGRAGVGTSFAGSALRLLDVDHLTGTPVEAVVASRAETASVILARAMEMLSGADGLTVGDAQRIAEFVALLAPTPSVRRAELLASSPELAAAVTGQQQVFDAATRTAAAASGWHAPLGPEDARAALEIARRRETSMWRAFSGDWRRVQGLVAARFSAGDRVIAPSASEALTTLVAHQEADAAAAASRESARRIWGHPELPALQNSLAAAKRWTGLTAQWRDAVSEDDAALARTVELPDTLGALTDALRGFVVDVESMLVADLQAGLAFLASSAGQTAVRGAAGPIASLGASPGVLTALRQLDARPDELEYAVLTSALLTARAGSPQLDSFDGSGLGDVLRRITALIPQIQQLNAQVITARLRTRFRDEIEHSQRSVSGMAPEDRQRKKTWATGRRELEHEFGKTRAYKSIRQLAAAEPGAVVATMRPVWLMSPSSLSDTLPLEDTFDVVIFDEASQIPVEEAVPALYRATQVIAVGDKMQLPPTQYFTARQSDGTLDSDEEESSTVGVVLDADSFLSVSSARLPSTMLLWHYRSRYEALIQFSNAAFYGGRLATIPDRVAGGAVTGPITVTVEGQPDAAAAVDALLARSITMMQVRDGVYVQRTNPAEATWIASLVRELLRRETGDTFGVVAFSEAQQSEIERALERLSSEDPDFATRYEAELAREDDGQSVGIFVKNLENVQGDERDTILMSVCYAPGPDGRMRMNFGPINNAGGEKRLNVIFSRARKHMVLVSTIDHTAVTNTYNDGANTLKNFLRYAAAVSEGDDHAAATVLAGLRDRHVTGAVGAAGSAAADQIADALSARGIDVRRDVGQSNFRCDLALRLPGSPNFTTAVLVDHASRLDHESLDERRVVQPSALLTAGWRVEHVLSTEWLDHPDIVLDRLVTSISRVL
jgi:hypothetical protein